MIPVAAIGKGKQRKELNSHHGALPLINTHEEIRLFHVSGISYLIPSASLFVTIQPDSQFGGPLGQSTAEHWPTLTSSGQSRAESG